MTLYNNKFTFFIPRSEHTLQIETGVLMLNKRKHLNLSLNYIPFDSKKYPTLHMAFAEIEGVKMVFDMLDGYNINQNEMELILEKTDVYFKRSCDKVLNKDIRGGEKIIPLGLNYKVQYPTIKNYLRKILYPIQRFYGYEKEFVLFPSDIALAPVFKNKDLNIIYITRLWNPDETSNQKSKDERIIINKNRIDLCRKIKEQFPYSVCGLMNSELALEMAPDLVLPQAYTRRNNYIKLVHKSDICITTTGLFNSVGWRFGEYVASSKVIISEPLFYDIPYDFKESKNYYVYDSVKSCIDKIKMIMNNPELANRMKNENWNYYNKYLRPDNLVYSAISQFAHI